MQNRVVALLLILGCFAGSEPPTLQERVQQVVDEQQVPAVGLLISTPDGVQIAVAGDRTIGGEPVTVDDAWHIGSCTKAITALLAGRLVDQDIISLDSTPADVLKELPESAKALGGKITLRQLLSHTSGLPGRELDAIALPLSRLQISLGFESTILRRNVTYGILAIPPAASPGETWAYCNGGYIVASSMLEAAAGKPFDQLMQDQVLQPLNITTAGWGPPPKIQGHVREDDAWKPIVHDNPKPYDAAGRLHLSLEDWNSLCRIILEAGDFLQDDTRAALTKVVDKESGYALGWSVQNDPTHGTIYTHAGSNTMNLAQVIIVPSKNAIILAVCNAPSGQAVTELSRLGVGMLQEPRPAATAPRPPRAPIRR